MLPFEIDCVTVCVNYSDYLTLTLERNARYFSRVLIVTDPKDELTPAVCSKYPNVSFMRTSAFYWSGAPFAKGDALNIGLYRLNPKGWVVTMDADIVISDSIASVFSTLSTLDPERIYGPKIKYHVQKSEEGSNLHGGGTACAGFFQIFNWPYAHRNNILYPNTSGDCSEDDIKFSKLFKGVSYINPVAYHIGPSMPDGIPNVNWKGRVSPPNPVTVEQLSKFYPYPA